MATPQPKYEHSRPARNVRWEWYSLHSLIAARRLFILPVLALILASQLALLRPGQGWGDDFAQYIHHARNLLEGRPYADIGLIENPAVTNLGPRYYPPGYPMILGPVLAVFGLDFTALKVEIALLLTAALWFIYLLAREQTSVWAALVIVPLIGLNPVICTMGNSIGSDLPFVTAAYGALYLIHMLYTRSNGSPRAIWGLPVGLSIYAAYALRQPGLVLLPALIAFDVTGGNRKLGLRAPRALTIVAVIVALACMGAQLGILGGDGRSSLFRFTPAWLATSAVQSVVAFSVFFHSAWSHALSRILFAFAVAFIARGVWARLRSGAGICEFFLLFYLAMLIPYPYPETRYLVPIFPILMVYLVQGFAAFTACFRPRAVRFAAAAALLVAAAFHASEYASAERGPIREGVADPEFVALCEYSRDHTPADARFIARKPRLFSLLSGRAAGIYSPLAAPDELLSFMNSVRAEYLIEGNPPAIDFDADLLTLEPFVKRYGDALTIVYQTAHYRIYRVEPSSSKGRG